MGRIYHHWKDEFLRKYSLGDTMNSVSLLGRLGRDPELKELPSTKLCNFSLATGTGEQTEWHNITAFGKTAELASNYLSKGSQVVVQGRIQSREYTNKEGVKMRSTDIIAERVHFVGTRKEETKTEPAYTSDQIPF